MTANVAGKQPNSRMCLVCGLDNAMGLRAAFFDLEDGRTVALFSPRDEHQGYPGVLHGGITAAILDETIGRAVWSRSAQDVWFLTTEVQVRFRKPIPLGQELRVVGRVTKDSKRFFEGEGEVLLPDGQIGATARARYMKLPPDHLAGFDPDREKWKVTPLDSDPAVIDTTARKGGEPT